jgi:hypothetical protein
MTSKPLPKKASKRREPASPARTRARALLRKIFSTTPSGIIESGQGEDLSFVVNGVTFLFEMGATAQDDAFSIKNGSHTYPKVIRSAAGLELATEFLRLLPELEREHLSQAAANLLLLHTYEGQKANHPAPPAPRPMEALGSALAAYRSSVEHQEVKHFPKAVLRAKLLLKRILGERLAEHATMMPATNKISFAIDGMLLSFVPGATEQDDYYLASHLGIKSLHPVRSAAGLGMEIEKIYETVREIVKRNVV